MTEEENLSRWQDSGDPHRWVWQRKGEWIIKDYDCLLASLRTSSFWPMAVEEIAKTLEAARQTYFDLARWHLLGNQVHQDPPDDEEIWF